MRDKENCSHGKEPLFQYVKDCYWSIFRGNTAILSSTCRQLALGIGGVLLFEKQTNHLTSTKIIFTLLVFFFVFDAMQYLYQSMSFRKLAEKYDKKIEKSEILDVSKLVEPPNISKVTNYIFIVKLVLLAIASMIFLCVVWSN